VKGSQLEGRTILVEDEPLVPLEVVEALTACGACVVSVARVSDAIKSVDIHQISAAVLDIKLGNNDCGAICQYLQDRGIPFLFLTGYSAPLDGFSSVPVVAKPASSRHITGALERLCGLNQQVG
jgi:CheY-like chemotaxis protein